MFWIFIPAGIIVFLFAAIVFCVAPGKISLEAKKTSLIFKGLNCAHRGLHTEDQAVPENSAAAFEKARKAGYGIELDVQLSKDEKVIVFHDDDLKRVCGTDAPVNSKTLEELSALPLYGTKEFIPLFTEVLKITGDTPLIVELKSAGGKNSRLCEETLKILKEQGINYCIESFDPRIVAWFKNNAPEVLRGQLSRQPKNMEGITKLTAFLLGNLLTNFMARPHFIAYESTKHPLTVKLCRAMKPINVVWTIKPEHDIKKFEKENDTIIFEYYEPEPRYI